jgi:predicted phage-related endonuclease
MIIIHNNITQGSPEWFAMREGLWTGSTAVKLMQGKPLPPSSEWQGNIYTKRGQMLEMIAIKEYEREVGHEVSRPGFVTNTLYKNAGYSPDAIDGDILIENKSLNGTRHEDLVAGKIPLEYLCQIYFGMVITGRKKARLLAFNPEYPDQLVIIDIKYNAKICGNIRKKLRLDMKNHQTT